jgi:hypothetical protein
MSDSIYDSSRRRSSPHWPAPAPRTSSATLQTSTTIASSCDAHLAAILDAPLRTGEPTNVGYARKERELAAAFAALPIFDQRALHARLARPKPGDALAVKFGRLVAERRQRLINFLGDARRRAAIAAAKR